MKCMRKLGIFVLLVFMTLLSSQTFWYFENKAYCSFEDKNVTISIKKVEWSARCGVYMDTIYQLALKKYSEISTIRSYIIQGEDVYYWKWILDEKNSEFLQLVNYRTQIKAAVDKFEWALFDKYYNLLQKPMQVYYSDLEAQYYILANQHSSAKTPDYSLKLAQLEQQMWNVNHILKAEKLDHIMEVLSSYIYLRREIEWK